jgi:hypothetical protein
VELPGTKLGSVTVVSNMGDTPETEISFCTYEGEEINENELSNYYLLEK